MSSVVDGDNVDKFQRWDLPELGDSGTGYAGPMTPGEMEKLQQQAYQEGFERGHRDGLDAGRQAVAEQARQLEQLLGALTRPFEELDEQVEEELLELVFAIVRQLAGNEISENPEQILALVHKTVAMLPSASRNLQLYLHPDDLQLVHDILPAADSSTPWHVIEDISVGRGGCRVSTETSRVDATLETRLANIVNSLLGGDHDHDKDMQE
ncbi:MAG: FliH/SctL family protein [Gammaproteobacteria bacterium]|jgi:flagellar assembly protein FliH